MRRFDKLFAELGYCSRKRIRSFVERNEVTVNGKQITLPDKHFKPRTLVDPSEVLLNGEPLYMPYPLSIALYKPPNMHCFPVYKYNRDLDDTKSSISQNTTTQALTATNTEDKIELFRRPLDDFPSMFELLPETFPNRRPEMRVINPLTPTASGLVLLTQYDNFYKMFISVRTPLPRVYEVQVEDKLTGLEPEMFKMLRGEVKPSVKAIIDAPRFEIIDEGMRTVRITLSDYKPDNVEQMLLSIRHIPVRIKRISIGNLSLDDLDLKEGYWREMEQEHVDKIMDCKREIVRRRNEVNGAQIAHKKLMKEQRNNILEKFDDFNLMDRMIERQMIEQERELNDIFGIETDKLPISKEEKQIHEELQRFATKYKVEEFLDMLDNNFHISKEMLDQGDEIEKLKASNDRKQVVEARKKQQLFKQKLQQIGHAPYMKQEAIVGPRGIVDDRLLQLFDDNAPKKIAAPKKQKEKSVK
jgi:16S rRNA U516 pseudouridylate synthase RsuA-like enzyme